MVTFANLGSGRLPSLKFVGLRVWKIWRIQCTSAVYIYYNSFPVIRTTIAKSRHFYVPRASKRCMNEKPIQCLPNPTQHVPIYIQQFPSYSNHKCKKIAVFTYRSPHFCFSWRRPCDYHAMCCMDGKTIQCLPNPSQHVPYLSIFNSFRVIRCLSQCVSPKIAIFTTFLFPLGQSR